MTRDWRALSKIVGIPRDRCACLAPLVGRKGFGIQIRRKGDAFVTIFSLDIREKRSDCDRKSLSSTPAVLFPVLSCVTLRTAKAFPPVEKSILQLYYLFDITIT